MTWRQTRTATDRPLLSTLSLATWFFVLLYHSSCLLSLFPLTPSYSLSLSLFPICARVRVSMHAYTFGTTPTPACYHYRHTVANCPTTPVLFLRSTPSRTRYFVTVSLSSPSFLLLPSSPRSSSLLRHFC